MAALVDQRGNVHGGGAHAWRGYGERALDAIANSA